MAAEAAGAFSSPSTSTSTGTIAPPTIRRITKGADMSTSVEGNPARGYHSYSADYLGVGGLDPEVVDTLVDRVVERIEGRVVEELERRGRRAMPGVF